MEVEVPLMLVEVLTVRVGKRVVEAALMEVLGSLRWVVEVAVGAVLSKDCLKEVEAVEVGEQVKARLQLVVMVEAQAVVVRWASSTLEAVGVVSQAQYCSVLVLVLVVVS